MILKSKQNIKYSEWHHGSNNDYIMWNWCNIATTVVCESAISKDSPSRRNCYRPQWSGKVMLLHLSVKGQRGGGFLSQHAPQVTWSGVSVHRGSLSTGGLCQAGSLVQWGLCQGGLCPRGSLSGRSLSRGESLSSLLHMTNCGHSSCFFFQNEEIFVQLDELRFNYNLTQAQKTF